MSYLLDALQWLYTFWIMGNAIAKLFQHVGPGKVYELAVRVHQEFWIVAPIGWLSAVWEVATGPAGRSFMLLFHAIGAWIWWTDRNWPDDNIWKRRSKRAVESVKVSGSRLVVVPT